MALYTRRFCCALTAERIERSRGAEDGIASKVFNVSTIPSVLVAEYLGNVVDSVVTEVYSQVKESIKFDGNITSQHV
jgi:hypothetical protein